MGLNYLPNKPGIKSINEDILLQIGASLGLEGISLNHVVDKLWLNICNNNPKIDIQSKNRGKILNSYFKSNKHFVLNMKEVKIFLKSAIRVLNTNEISRNELEWFAGVLKNTK